jgi:PAS domain S-box-containing protein
VLEPRRGRTQLSEILAAGGFDVHRALDDPEAMVEAVGGDTAADCVLVRHDPPEFDAIDLVPRVRAKRSDLAVVVATHPDHLEAVMDAAPTEVLELRPDGTVAPSLAAHRLRSAIELATGRQAADRRNVVEAFADALPDYAFVLDADGRYLDILTGRRSENPLFEPDKLRGELLEDVLPANAAQRLHEGITEAIESEALAERTYRLRSPEDERWYEGRLAPLDASHYGRPAVLLVAREVTGRRERRREAEETRATLQRTFERISDAVFAVDDEWNVTYANEAGGDVLRAAMGLESAATVVGRHLWDEIPEAVDTAFYEHYHEAMRTQEPTSFESYYEPLGVWFSVTAYPDPDGVSVYFSDVTERKRRETALNELLEASQALMAATSKDEIASIVGEAAASIIGFPANAVRLYDEGTGLLHPVSVSDRTEQLMGGRDPYPPGESITGRAFADGEPVYVQNAREFGDDPAYEDVGAVFAHPLGRHGVVSVGTTEPDAVADSDRALVGVLAANAEVALDRADSEREMRQLQRVIDHVGGTMFLLDVEDRLAFVTAGFAETLGYGREALLGRPLGDLVDDGPEDAAVYEAALESVRRGEATAATAEVGVFTAGGDVVPAEFEFSPVDDVAGEVAGSMTDIRELASAREELAAEQERFRELFESLPLPVVEVAVEDGRAVVEFVNGQFADAFGYDPATLRGESLNAFIAPSDASAAELDEKVAKGEQLSIEVQRQTADGTRDFLLRASPYPGTDGVRAFGIYTDITDQRERERYLQILNRVLRHNFRNDLTVVVGLADMLASDVDDEVFAGYARKIREAGEGLAALSETARELETLVGQRATERGTVDAVERLEAALDACEETTDATVTLDVPASLDILAGSRVQRAFEELIENAIVHSDREPPRLHIDAERTGDGRVDIRFVDDGPGIPDDEWQVISGEADITPLQHGTGLGLWVVRWIVDSYDGQLRRSSEGSGTTVVLSFDSAPAT